MNIQRSLSCVFIFLTAIFNSSFTGIVFRECIFFYQKDVISETINITLSRTSHEMLYFYHRFATCKIITRGHIHTYIVVSSDSVAVLKLEP